MVDRDSSDGHSKNMLIFWCSHKLTNVDKMYQKEGFFDFCG